MAEHTERKLNQLERLLPDGLLVDAAWLTKHGYSTSLRSQYVSAGWLEQPTRQVYRRTRDPLHWSQAIISLQTLLERDLTIGGRSALAIQGYSHYLVHETKAIHLYGPDHPPAWLSRLPLDVTFVYHNSGRLFSYSALQPHPNSDTPFDAASTDSLSGNPVSQPWDHWEKKIAVSRPERALLELLDELPDRETFHQVDKVVEGLANLSPRRLENLLKDCRSVKVKRLFFFFADRHQHAWLKRISKDAIDLGKGKRMLVRGGKLNAAYQITVPEDVDAVQ